LLNHYYWNKALVYIAIIMLKTFFVERCFLAIILLFGMSYCSPSIGAKLSPIISPFEGFNSFNLSPLIASRNLNIVQIKWKEEDGCLSFIDKKVVVKKFKDYISYRQTCPIEGEVLVLNSSVDFNLKLIENIRNSKDVFLVSSFGIRQSLELAFRAFRRVAVLYAPKPQLNFTDITNRNKDVFFYEVNTPTELIHAFGKMARRYDAVIIDGQGKAFTDSSIKVIRSISFKYKLPIIGGLSEDYLFQGSVAGVYNSNETLVDCLARWARDKSCRANKDGKVIFNDSLLKYFGLSRADFGERNDNK